MDLLDFYNEAKELFARFDVNELYLSDPCYVIITNSELIHLITNSKYRVHYPELVDHIKGDDNELLTLAQYTYISACKSGDVRPILHLVDKKTALNERYNGLMRASASGNVDAIGPLIEFGIRINDFDIELFSPLHCAIRCYQPKSVKVLLSMGANKYSCIMALTPMILALLLFHEKYSSGDNSWRRIKILKLRKIIALLMDAAYILDIYRSVSQENIWSYRVSGSILPPKFGLNDGCVDEKVIGVRLLQLACAISDINVIKQLLVLDKLSKKDRLFLIDNACLYDNIEAVELFGGFEDVCLTTVIKYKSIKIFKKIINLDAATIDFVELLLKKYPCKRIERTLMNCIYEKIIAKRIGIRSFEFAKDYIPHRK